MKYQFTVEGSKSQTNVYQVTILGAVPEEGILWKTHVSTPLTADELEDFIESRLIGVAEGFHCWVKASDKEYADVIIGLDKLARILSNIKPLKQKVVISICGERKTYELDADKLESLLKSLE
jgi:hypothetical protein